DRKPQFLNFSCNPAILNQRKRDLRIQTSETGWFVEWHCCRAEPTTAESKSRWKVCLKSQPLLMQPVISRSLNWVTDPMSCCFHMKVINRRPGLMWYRVQRLPRLLQEWLL